jgi:hypothetical protein
MKPSRESSNGEHVHVREGARVSCEDAGCKEKQGETPRTDALVKVVLGEEVCNATEMKDHARKLERELAEARSAWDESVRHGLVWKQRAEAAQSATPAMWQPIATAPYHNEPLIVLTEQGNICEADNFAGLWNMPLAYQDDAPVAWIRRPDKTASDKGQE